MNNYLTGIEGMPRLLDSCADPMPDFKRKVYAEAFQKKIPGTRSYLRRHRGGIQFCD